MSLPPDLRVLCRRLTSTPTAQLPHAIPSLVSHVLRCKHVLSSSLDPKAKNSSEAAVLVHKLKRIIKTLLDGKTAAGRFTGVVLAKAVVDVGGWECLRETGPWVASMLSIIQVRPLPPRAFHDQRLTDCRKTTRSPSRNSASSPSSGSTP